MKIGVPKEIKTNENRIALVPAGAESLVAAGHSVLIETSGGLGSGFPDEAYTAVGAKIAPDAATVWRESDMIMKVKEPIEREWPHMRRGQLIFTYFHFAADEKLTEAHLDERRDLRRLRDGRAADARAAAADADVRGRGPDGGAGGRQVPREAVRRTRRVARRRPGRRSGEGRHPRRRHRRHQRGEDGRRNGRQGDDPGSCRSSVCATSPTSCPPTAC